MNSLESYDGNLYNNIAKEEYDPNQTQKNVNTLANNIKSADDGIPQNWNLPSTPIINYNSNNQLSSKKYGQQLANSITPPKDYYGHEGVTPSIQDGLQQMFIPDHDPLIGSN